MNGTADILDPDQLLAGPRGRRLLLEYALDSAHHVHRDDDASPIHSAVFSAAYHLESGQGRSRTLLAFEKCGLRGSPKTQNYQPDETSAEDDAARLLETLTLSPVTHESLRRCLDRAVSLAAYWQPPSGEDVLVASAPMLSALKRVADHLVRSPLTRSWTNPVTTSTQWSIAWDDGPPLAPPATGLGPLLAERVNLLDDEARAARERPNDPSANWSGQWWSTPGQVVPASWPETFDGAPAGLWFIEDDLGWERAEAVHLGVPAGINVYEVDHSRAWADLCRRFPIELTSSKRHDWYRTTGRVGRWVMPDWAEVGRHYDAVHLQTAAYLTAAGTAITVNNDTATVIAGWSPDATYWFTDRVRYLDEPVDWRLIGDGIDAVWQRDAG